MKNNKIAILLLCLFGGMFYLLNIYTPLELDDMIYSRFINQDGSLGERIGSVLDVITSQYNHYFVINGRYWVHSLVQLFSGWIGKDCFNFFNTVLFILFILLFLINVKDRKQNLSLYQIGISLFVFWFLIPALGDTLLWLSGSMNYLYSIVWALFFLWIFSKVQNGQSINFILLFICGLFTGWTHEALGLCLSGAVFFYCCLLYRDKGFSRSLIPLIIGLWIGTLFVALSPGIWNRADGSVADFSMHNLIWNIARVTIYVKAFPILVFLSIIVGLKYKKTFINFIFQHGLLLGFVLLSYLFCCLIGLQSIRQFFFLEIISIILILRVLFEYNMTLLQKVRIPLSTVMLVVFLIDYAKGLQACKYDYDIRMDIYEQYERSADGVVSTTYQRKSDWLHEYKASRYVCFLMYSHKSGYINSMATWYWGTPEKKMIVLPESLYESLYKNNEFCNPQNLSVKIGEHNSYTAAELDFYIVPVEEGEKVDSHNRSVYFTYDPTIENSLPWYVKLIRPFSKRLNPLNSFILQDAVTRLKTPHGDYLLIDKPRYLVGKVEGIQID